MSGGHIHIPAEGTERMVADLLRASAGYRATRATPEANSYANGMETVGEAFIRWMHGEINRGVDVKNLRDAMAHLLGFIMMNGTSQITREENFYDVIVSLAAEAASMATASIGGPSVGGYQWQEGGTA